MRDLEPMRFMGHTELTDEERKWAIEYAEKMGVSSGVIMHRMSGWGRIYD